MMDKQSEELKPLVWVNATDDGQVQDAAGLNAGYRVWLSSSGITRWQINYMGEWFVAASFDLAKAAAQADYAGRIRAELNVAPVSLAEAARVLLDNMPNEHDCWAALQDAVDEGKDEDDCIRAWLRAIAEGTK